MEMAVYLWQKFSKNYFKRYYINAYKYLITKTRNTYVAVEDNVNHK